MEFPGIQVGLEGLPGRLGVDLGRPVQALPIQGVHLQDLGLLAVDSNQFGPGDLRDAQDLGAMVEGGFTPALVLGLLVDTQGRASSAGARLQQPETVILVLGHQGALAVLAAEVYGLDLPVPIGPAEGRLDVLAIGQQGPEVCRQVLGLTEVPELQDGIHGFPVFGL